MSRATRLGLLTIAVAATGGEADAQRLTPPSAVFRYTSAQLACVSFHERSRGRLYAQIGTRQRRETLQRDGVLRMRAAPAGSGIALEAWYDSLALSRESPETALVPDTDGLLGGRYRGRLTPMGGYTASVVPFVPDEIAEVAEMGGAMEDFLPPLPAIALAVGQRWADDRGLELRRLPDSVAGRRVVQRLELRARTASDTAAVRGTRTPLAAREVTTEEGQVDWDPRLGLLRRARRLVVETAVPAGGPVRLPLRSRLEQQVTVVRVKGGECEGMLDAAHPSR
ncbi:MAG: hypothetical protein H0T86_10660 [Gemmatimonadales bacterium]|nr:hypothetical protein [Gemmatimonadales bacterium]